MDVSEIIIGDLRRCCRVCLEEPHRVQMLDMNVIYDEEANLTYYECYEICTKENLEECGDQEPNTLCKHCGVELQWAYDFHKKVAQAKQQLRNMQTVVETVREDQEEDEKYIDQGEEDEHLDRHLATLEKTPSEPETTEPDTPKPFKTHDYTNVNDVITRIRYSGQFNCQFCKKQFRNHCQMVKHQLIHLSDRPQFQCSSCDRFYLTKQALKVHENTKHNKSGSFCPICGKVFGIAKGLEIHMRYHNGYFPFDCHKCDRKFAQRSHLKVHLQVQHSSARFLCEFLNCGKMFTSSSALRNHECTHSEMPFECNVCQQGFPARYKLRLHAQRKHNMQLTLEQLETMRKFHIMRSKRVLAKIDTQLQETEAINDN